MSDEIRRSPVDVVTTALVNQPEQGDWPWEDHCAGVAGQVVRGLATAGFDIDALTAERDELRAVVDRLDLSTSDAGFVTVTRQWWIENIVALAGKAEAAAVGWEACADRLGHGKVDATNERNALRQAALTVAADLEGHGWADTADRFTALRFSRRLRVACNPQRESSPSSDEGAS